MIDIDMCVAKVSRNFASISGCSMYSRRKQADGSYTVRLASFEINTTILLPYHYTSGWPTLKETLILHAMVAYCAYKKS